READAKVERQASQEQALDAAFAQVAGQAGWRGAVVLVERRVGVDRRIETFANDKPGMGNLQSAVKGRAGRALDAMVGPQHLRPIGHRDRVVGSASRMRRGE